MLVLFSPDYLQLSLSRTKNVCYKEHKYTPRRKAAPHNIMFAPRFSEKATPSDFLMKQVYFWDEQTVQMYVPAAPWRGQWMLSL